MGVRMNPCELNTMVAATANYLFASLSEQEFKRLTVFLSDLSKSMLSMTAYREICKPKPVAPKT